MKAIVAIFSILLLSMSYSGNTEIFASTTQQEKQDIIDDLENIKNNSEINKKSKGNIESAIKKLEKSLNSKYWKDESTVNFKHGKKVLNADQQAVNKLDNISKNKKSSNGIKEEITNINIKITQLDKTLVGNAINELEEIVMSEKGIKKIDKAIEKFEKGNELLDDEKYSKALKKYGKAWDQIKKALKDPHFKKMRIVELEGVGFLDNTFDNIPDVYLKVSKSTKENKPKLVEIRITNDCVNGITHDNATMKIGLSTPREGPGKLRSTEFFDEGYEFTNKWFKQNDPDKKINPAVITTISEYSYFPESGDDLIQINPENQKGSFEYSAEPIPEIGNQSGWIGEFTVDGIPGDYEIQFWMPLTSPTSEGDSCNFISSFPIDHIIE